MTNRILKASIFQIVQDLKDCLRTNRSWKGTKNCYPEEDKLLTNAISAWTEILEDGISRIREVSKLHFNRSKSYCSNAANYETHTEKIKKILLEKDLYHVINRAEEAETALYEIGWDIGRDGELKEEKIKKYSFLISEEFEKWEQKSRSRKVKKPTYQVKKEYTKKEGEKMSIKSFCCSTLGAIRDFMIQEMKIEDYKNDTSEIGLLRKKVLGSLMAYSKTQDPEKIENFKKSVVGRFSQVFGGFENLKNQLLELEQKFKG